MLPTNSVSGRPRVGVFPAFLWNRQVHYRGHKSTTAFPVPIQIIPVYALRSYFFKIHLNVILPSTPWYPSGFFPSGISTNTLYGFMYSSMPSMLLPLVTTCFKASNNVYCYVLISNQIYPVADNNAILLVHFF